MQEYEVRRLNRGNAHMSAGVDVEPPSHYNTWGFGTMPLGCRFSHQGAVMSVHPTLALITTYLGIYVAQFHTNNRPQMQPLTHLVASTWTIAVRMQVTLR